MSKIWINPAAIPTEEESMENYRKWSNNFETRYIMGCDPYKEEE